MIRSPRRNRGIASLLLVAVVALTGCAPTKAGSAAIVGDEALSQNTLTQLAKGVQGVASKASVALPQADQLNQQVISVWVDMQLTQALADEVQITATKANVDSLLSQFSPDQLVQIQTGSGIAPAMLPDVAKSAVLRQLIAAKLAPGQPSQAQTIALGKAYRDVAAKLGVSINPRFGTWNPLTVQVDAPSNSLSQSTKVVGTPGGVPVLPPPGG